jgi:hypothetical protein
VIQRNVLQREKCRSHQTHHRKWQAPNAQATPESG